MGLLPRLGFSADQAKAAILEAFAADYGGTLSDGVRPVLDGFAAAVGKMVERNNQKVADDLSEQVARFMGGRMR